MPITKTMLGDVEIPEQPAPKVGGSAKKDQALKLLEQGKTVQEVAATVGVSTSTVYEWRKLVPQVPSAPTTKPHPKKAEPKPVPAAKSKTLESTVCEFCGKTLSRGSSVEKGCGDVCESKRKHLPAGVTIEQHYRSLTVPEIPKGWMLFSQAVREAMAAGMSGHRFIQICGGDRHITPPLNEHFRVVFVKGKRYISPTALKHLDEGRKR